MNFLYEASRFLTSFGMTNRMYLELRNSHDVIPSEA